MLDRTSTSAAASSASGSGHALSLQGVRFGYGATTTLNEVTLNVAQGEVVALLGPSGCGKTTILKLVAGLLSPLAGKLIIAGITAADAGRGTFLAPEQRKLGMVFQDYALWPHLSVGDNVGFPLEMQNVPKAERAPRVREALARVGLKGFEDRQPAQLSGGQQQRVAVARAIVGRPALVLFDEPLSNLDRELRGTLALELADLIRAEGLTAVYVTHDQSEAFAIADRIVVMRAGNIVQDASPEELVAHPADAMVADFLSLGVSTQAVRHNGHWHLADTGIALCTHDAAPKHLVEQGTEQARVLLRHGSVIINSEGAAHPTAAVLRSTFNGSGYSVAIRAGDDKAPLDLTAMSQVKLASGSRVGMSVDPRHIFWFQS